MKLSRIVLSIALLSSLPLQAGVVNVGSGSYTTDHPGYDQAGRNKVPAGTPQLSGDAVGHPVEQRALQGPVGKYFCISHGHAHTC